MIHNFYIRFQFEAVSWHDSFTSYHLVSLFCPDFPAVDSNFTVRQSGCLLTEEYSLFRGHKKRQNTTAGFGLRDSRLADISPRFWPPQCSSRLARDSGAFLAGRFFFAAEMLVSPRSCHLSRRDFNRRDFYFAKISPMISARIRPPRSRPISRRDENLGGQKRAGISEKMF